MNRFGQVAAVRLVTLFALGSGIALVVSGCHPRAALPAARPVGGLIISCDPPDAEVYVDDRYVGTVASLGDKPLTLPVGLRRVELRRGGYFSAYHDVELARGVRQRLSVKLRQEPF